MNRATAINGACVMIGLLCGVLLCLQSPPGSGGDPGRDLDAPSLSPIRLVVNDARVEVDGWARSDGKKTWLWRDQDCRPSRPTNLRCQGGCSRAWVDGEINGRPCRLLGWWTPAGFRWRWDEQRSSYEPGGRGDQSPATGGKAPASTPAPLRRGDLSTDDTDPRAGRDDPAPIASGLVLPSGFEPKQDPRTGALLMGVDPAGLAKDGERVRASDPQTKTEVEDVRKFYAQAPDASAQAVARNLPKVVSPNSWAAVFGYDLPTALIRIGGVGLLGGAAFMAHRRISGVA